MENSVGALKTAAKHCGGALSEIRKAAFSTIPDGLILIKLVKNGILESLSRETIYTKVYQSRHQKRSN